MCDRTWPFKTSPWWIVDKPDSDSVCCRICWRTFSLLPSMSYQHVYFVDSPIIRFSASNLLATKHHLRFLSHNIFTAFKIFPSYIFRLWWRALELWMQYTPSWTCLFIPIFGPRGSIQQTMGLIITKILHVLEASWHRKNWPKDLPQLHSQEKLSFLMTELHYS